MCVAGGGGAVRRGHVLIEEARVLIDVSIIHIETMFRLVFQSSPTRYHKSCFVLVNCTVLLQ